jgi:hypothetical protein
MSRNQRRNLKTIKQGVGIAILIAISYSMITHPIYTFIGMAIVSAFISRHAIVCKIRGYHKMNYYTDTCRCGRHTTHR